jgi:uncharacterized repeat protein (TIGR03803 family)
MTQSPHPCNSHRRFLISFLTVLFVLWVQAPNASAASKYKVLYSFKGGNDGASPYGGLTLDPVGNLYGTTYLGGINAAGCGTGNETGCGTVFKLTHGSGGWTKSLLYTFCSQSSCTDGAAPNGDMVFSPAGVLYGTTFQGGSCPYSCGTAFELVPDSKGDWQHAVIYAFQGGSDTVNPDGGLVFDHMGNLYGTSGGVNLPEFGDQIQFGAVFVLTPGVGGWAERVLYNFCSRKNCSDGFSPAAALVWVAANDLYGATFYGGQEGSFACRNNGCGVLFKLTPNSKDGWMESVLHPFVGADGTHSISALISDDQGNLYGTTISEGAFGDGSVFRLSPASNGNWKYSVLHEFSTGRLGGDLFRSAFVLDSRGNLYGTTWTGGAGGCNAQGCGLVYKLAPGAHDTWKYTDLHDFTGGQDGGFPTSRLAIDKNGNLYGVTQIGGDNENGVVFEVTP